MSQPISWELLRAYQGVLVIFLSWVPQYYSQTTSPLVSVSRIYHILIAETQKLFILIDQMYFYLNIKSFTIFSHCLKNHNRNVSSSFCIFFLRFSTCILFWKLNDLGMSLHLYPASRTIKQKVKIMNTRKVEETVPIKSKEMWQLSVLWGLWW